MKKPRADSVLKTLHPVKQQQLFQMLLTTEYAAAVTWVKKEFGIETSVASLHRFYSWYPFSRQLEEHSELKKELMETLRDLPDLDLSDEQVSKAAQLAFENRAVRMQDSKLFLGLRNLRIRERNLELEAQKYRDSLKTKLETGLDALHAELRGNEAALKIFNQLKEALAAS